MMAYTGPFSSGEEESPIGPLIGDATAEGYQTGATAPIPFHGYLLQNSSPPRKKCSRWCEKTIW